MNRNDFYLQLENKMRRCIYITVYLSYVIGCKKMYNVNYNYNKNRKKSGNSKRREDYGKGYG